MTRAKKSRKVNANQPRQPQRVKQKNPQQGKKRGKGLASGTRHSQAATTGTGKSTSSASDPRLGSKKPVSLSLPNEPKALTPEQELTQLENDPRLEALLDQVEQGKTLPDDDQQWLDRTLDRIEALMAMLGIDGDDEANDKSEVSDYPEIDGDIDLDIESLR